MRAGLIIVMAITMFRSLANGAEVSHGNEDKIVYLFSSFRGNGEDVSDQLDFPEGTRHGTVFSSSKEILGKLLSR